jgi:PAS domain S-box-containing protein
MATDADARDTPVLFVNDQWLDLWHMPRVPASQVTAEFIIEHTGPFFADPDREVARIVEIIASGRPADDRLELNDGRVLLRRCRIAVTGQRQVRVWGFRDITAESRALQGLRDAAAQHQALLDAFPGVITANDEQLNLVYVNARFAELVGEPPERLLGTNIADRLTPEEAQVLRADVAKALAGQPVTVERHPPATADHPARDLLVTRVGGIGVDNKPLCYSFATDITELKRMQRELRAAKEEAERANRAKSAFLSNMSHELRTPLNAVLGFGQVLQMNTPGNLTAKQLRQATEIMRAGQHLLALINDLLDLARVEAGRMPISIEPVDLPDLLQECTELMAPVAQQADVELEPVDRRMAGLVVQADRTRLKQVLLNLLSNAIKYNLRHGRVWLGLTSAAPGRLRLQVCDSGPGLDDVAQARLFQPFERLNADQTPTDGSGVGLALSRRLMQLMHGDVGVESRLGEGSVFWLDLPLSEASIASRPVADEAAPGQVPGQAGHRAASLQVLCIDDNPVNLVLLSDMFELRPDLQLACTADPLHGLRLAKDRPPDVLLLDIQMPMVDGPEVLRRLRADPDTAGFPIIAISADAMPQVVQRCLANGFADYVTKPFTAERVFGAIDRALAGRRSAG